MGQFISFKSKINNPWFNPWFILLHTHSNLCANVELWSLEYFVCIPLHQMPKKPIGLWFYLLIKIQNAPSLGLKRVYRVNRLSYKTPSLVLFLNLIIHKSLKKIILRFSSAEANPWPELWFNLGFVKPGSVKTWGW